MTAPARLRRLSLLSELRLPERIFVPAHLEELNLVLPSLSKSYIWTDRKFNVIDIYNDRDQSKLIEGLQCFIKKYSPPNLRELFNHHHILTTDSQWIGHPYSRLYKQCFLANGYHQSFLVPIVINNTPHGLLILSWQKSEQKYENINPDLLEQIKAVFIEGLSDCCYQEKTTSGWRSGLISVDQRGEITNCCPEGKNLLAMALQKKAGNLRHAAYKDLRSIPGMIELITLTAIAEKSNNNRTLDIRSLWGDFQINAFPVIDEIGQRSTQVYLKITWQVPFSWLLFHNIDSMQLTPRQEVIALLYAAGYSTKSITNRLGLSIYTVKEHIQHIFEKLDIHTRVELIEHIICENSNLKNITVHQSNDILTGLKERL